MIALIQATETNADFDCLTALESSDAPLCVTGAILAIYCDKNTTRACSRWRLVSQTA
ncbi:hypothetical protein [Erythrobacter sp. SCSIO 43205]|uniref:hypothetical protein n=1 Tax=Erythrobacter sp. SCSIO 43205 TaxID=2779361 RepID=UPI002104B22C|nr:hypothetical protein [Erythrobacter sp. SCSIO 43205]